MFPESRPATQTGRRAFVTRRTVGRPEYTLSEAGKSASALDNPAEVPITGLRFPFARAPRLLEKLSHEPGPDRLALQVVDPALAVLPSEDRAVCDPADSSSLLLRDTGEPAQRPEVLGVQGGLLSLTSRRICARYIVINGTSDLRHAATSDYPLSVGGRAMSKPKLQLLPGLLTAALVLALLLGALTATCETTRGPAGGRAVESRPAIGGVS
jgi:hypothetical protein